jgi:hypothetical protein
MSNHGQDMTPEQRRHFEKFFESAKTDFGSGPTGKFPEGKIHPTDKGQLSMAIGHKDGKVFIHFGVPTDWIGFSKQDALNLANCIIEHAAQI